MQKVVGSSPIIRSASKSPGDGALLVLPAVPAPPLPPRSWTGRGSIWTFGARAGARGVLASRPVERGGWNAQGRRPAAAGWSVSQADVDVDGRGGTKLAPTTRAALP